MDGFNPGEGYAPADYNPEDEYAPIDDAAQTAAQPAQSFAEQAHSAEPAAAAQPAESQGYDPMYQAQPQYQPQYPVNPAPPQGTPSPYIRPQFTQAYQPQPYQPLYRPKGAPNPFIQPQYQQGYQQPPYAQPQQAQSAQQPGYAQPQPQSAQYQQAPAQPPVQPPLQPPVQPPVQPQAQAPAYNQQAAPYAEHQYQPQPQQYQPQQNQFRPQPPVQQPVQPPYGPMYQPPYQQQIAPQPKEPKPRTSTGTKVFLIVLSALLVALVIGFIVYISTLANNDKKTNNNDSSILFPRDIYDDILDDGSDNNDNSLINGSGYQEFEDEITLVDDNGDTQKRADDNPDSVGEPNEKAKGITLNALPDDKSDSKYTTESAYSAVCDSVVTVELYDGEISDNVLDVQSAGTGTIISADGYIVTNAHVIGNSRIYAVKIIMNSGDTYQAKIVGYDTWTDLALLKIDAKGLTPVAFGDPDLIDIGQDVIAIGSPGGEKFQNSLTKGIVSAVDRELTINKYVRYIQSDAAISPGNSGGPLCNIYGQVIGINTAKTTANYYEAMTFSIPADTVMDIVNDLMHYGYVKGRARIGFSGTEVSSEDQYYYGMPAGLYVGEIDPEGALAGTNIKEGDVITAIDGIEVATFQDVYAILAQHKPGDKLSVTAYRENN